MNGWISSIHLLIKASKSWSIQVCFGQYSPLNYAGWHHTVNRQKLLATKSSLMVFSCCFDPLFFSLLYFHFLLIRWTVSPNEPNADVTHSNSWCSGGSHYYSVLLEQMREALIQYGLQSTLLGSQFIFDVHRQETTVFSFKTSHEERHWEECFFSNVKTRLFVVFNK